VFVSELRRVGLLRFLWRLFATIRSLDDYCLSLRHGPGLFG
jgi:hypothetical protein